MSLPLRDAASDAAYCTHRRTPALVLSDSSVAVSNEVAPGLDPLFAAADSALYRAKAKGRNRWERLEPESAELHPRYRGVRNDTTAPSSARSDHRVGAVSPTSVR